MTWDAGDPRWRGAQASNYLDVWRLYYLFCGDTSVLMEWVKCPLSQMVESNSQSASKDKGSSISYLTKALFLTSETFSIPLRDGEYSFGY